jgi:glycosyltransferase involved in cell wall biosynthesis
VNLIIVTYSMSSNSLVFSHQRETVIALSKSFKSIDVLTSETCTLPLPANVRVTEIPWVKGSNVLNFLNIILVALPVLIKNRDSILFNYMTDVHAALLSPLAWLLRRRHVLWYAHASSSAYLIFSSFFVSKIVSSTPGSCNLRINRKKVVFINQGIKQTDFPFESRRFKSFHRLFYYGRFDRSKNIHLFKDLVIELNQKKITYNFEAFGQPVSLDSESYVRSLRTTSNSHRELKFQEPIPRKYIPEVSKKFDVFINLFTGSLDKTLIEVTLMGLPVVTWNQEFCNEFGTWSGAKPLNSLAFIKDEIYFLNSMDENEIQTEIWRRYQLAVKNHTFDGWIFRLLFVLKDGARV